jgi:chemotaxis protein CheY-P-specific phosphatase CheC
MQEQKAATLATIFSDVLADLAFMFTDEQHGESDPGDPWLETTIGYRGAMNGNLRFRCTRSFTRLLASNLLGADPDGDTAEDQADDAVKEFMNIVCGQLVTAIHGTEEVFNLTIPTVTHLEVAPDFSDDDGVTSATLSVEGCRLQLFYEPGD